MNRLYPIKISVSDYYDNISGFILFDEIHKIKHAKELFSNSNFKVEFKSQLKNDGMVNIIKKILKVD
ncbi:MAG: hypothetical protein JKX98_03075 [Alcanivoracaceae bacterium]|nr:hypothetical protein [Alcanivoracaceae bacterium]